RVAGRRSDCRGRCAVVHLFIATEFRSLTPSLPLTAARKITLEARSLEFAYKEARPGANRYDRETVFQLGPLSLELASREFLAIIGPNGSGKSTLLNVLGGMI